MKKILKITFVSLIILFSFISVDAASCSNSRVRIMTGGDRYFDKIGLVPHYACTKASFKPTGTGNVTGEDVDSTVAACLSIPEYYVEDNEFHEGSTYEFTGNYRDLDENDPCPSSNVYATISCTCKNYREDIKDAHHSTCATYNNSQFYCEQYPGITGCTYNTATGECTGDYSYYYCDYGYKKILVNYQYKCKYSWYDEYSMSKTDLASNLDTIKSNWLKSGDGDGYDYDYCVGCEKTNYNMNYTSWSRTCDEKDTIYVNADGYQFWLDTDQDGKRDSSEDRAFCINPGYSFNSDRVYKLDVDFDVSKCKNSLEYTLGKEDNKKCGFSNILIEGTRLFSDYSEEKRSGILYTALRFWAAYGESKFSDSLKGYSLTQDGYRGAGLPLRSTPGVTRYFLTVESTYKNTYVETLKAIFAGKYFDPGIDIFEVKSIDDLKELKCGDAALGQMCGTNYGYKEAVYLFVNTYQGNDLMIDHLKELVGAANDEIIPYAPVDIKTSVDKEVGEIQIIYEMDKIVEKECDATELNQEYCKANQKIVMVDDKGNKLVVDNFDYYDYCEKNYCYKIVDYTKYCNEKTMKTSQEVTITVTTDKTTISNTIKPYFTGTDYQSMYVIDLNNDSCTYNGNEINSNKFKYNIIEETVYDICPSPEQNDCCLITTNDPDEDYSNNVYAVTPDGNTYTSSNIMANPNICVGKGNFYTEGTKSQYNGVSVSSVGDPSLDCLVNLCYPADKAKYEYTELYNVNSKICRIMCRDEVKFVLANKTRVYAGMQFKYDIEPIALSKNLISRSSDINFNKDKAITGIVLQQRECVSEIYYDEDHKNDEGRYWLDYYNEVVSHNNVADALQLVYDLANCNLYTTEAANELINPEDLSDSDIKRDNYVPAYKCENGPCTTFDYLNKEYNTIEFGGTVTAEKITYSDTKYGNTAKLEKLESTTYTNNPTEIKYCKDSYVEDDTSTSKKETCFDYLKGQPTKLEVQNEKYENGNVTVKTNTILSSTKIKLPVNDYAIFTLTNETDFYNSTKYQVKNQTGVVSTIPETGVSKDSMALPNFVYPVSLGAEKGSYDISYTFEFTPFTRNRKWDAFAELLDKMKQYTCSYDVDNVTIKYPETSDHYGFEYRNIDPENMFPTNRVYGSNWSTEYAQGVASVIKEKADDIFIDESLLEYSFYLTTDSITQIRNYNNGKDYISDQNGHEFDNTLYNCDKENGMFLNCQSSFLHTANLESLGIEVLKDVSKTKGSIKEVEE